ncbi:MAG TPA: hypothetical protein VHU88_17425 [Sporichthyaceae bacterium]|jgi:hypothetical protein|nr:hypothetical protein [Sporichthyaceae bacterium]
MSLLSTFRMPVEAGGRSWTRAERECAPQRRWIDRLLGRNVSCMSDLAEYDGFGDQRARAMAGVARREMQAAVARPRPWR